MSIRIVSRVLLGIAFYALGGWFIWNALQEQDVGTELVRIYQWRGAAIVGLLIFARVLSAVSWGWLVVTSPQGKGLLLAGGVFALSAPGKYVPGKVLSLFARTIGARMLGVSVGRILSASGVEFILCVMMTAFIGVLIELWLASGWLALCGTLIALLAASYMPAAARRLLATSGAWSQRLELWSLLQSGTLLIVASLELLAAVCVAAGAALWFGSLDALTAQQIAAMTANYLQSSALSILMVIAPAGIGAREVVLHASLQGVVDQPLIATVLVTTRLLDVIADIVFTLLGGLVVARVRQAHKYLASAS